LIDKEAFQERKAALLEERALIHERRAGLNEDGWLKCEKAREKFELVQSLSLSGDPANSEERLDLLKTASSNLTADGKYVAVNWDWPFRTLVVREEFTCSPPSRDPVRPVETCPLDTDRSDASEVERPDTEWIREWCEGLCDQSTADDPCIGTLNP
jgi:hypothetical protein